MFKKFAEKINITEDKKSFSPFDKAHIKDTAAGLGIGAIAGAVSTAIVQPIDQIVNIKSTNSGKASRFGKSTYKDIMKSIYHGDIDPVKALSPSEYTRGLKGLKNFYSGMSVKLMKTAPQSAALLGLNALLYKAYKDYERNKLPSNG